MLAPALLFVVLSQAPVLTLDQALNEAEDNNLDLQVARARLAQAGELSRKAWAGYLPQLSVGGTYTYNSNEAKIALPSGYLIRDVGVVQGPAFDPTQPISVDNPPGAPTTLLMVPSAFTEAVIQPTHSLAGQAQLQQALVVPSLWFAIQSGGLAKQAATLSVENARVEILFATAQLYYGAEGLREAVEVQERLLEVNRQHERDAALKLEVGEAPKVALIRAQIELARSEQEVKRMQFAYASAKSALAALLNRAPDFEVVRPAAPAPPPEVEPAALVAQAREARPDVAAARVGLELAESGRRAAWAKYAPNVFAVARLQASNAQGFTGEYATWTLGAQLSWTLWDGGLRESELREAASKITESRAQLDAVEARVADEVRRALNDLASARANQAKANEQLKLARENSTLVDKAFETGAASYVEVVDANAALTAAELNHISEQLNAQLAVLKLARAAGRFQPAQSGATP